MYTVKQLSDLAGVTIRTLHYYDEIGLLSPATVGANGYRYYDDTALLRLQQILFYREIGLELLHIKDILDAPGFDLVAALRTHREALTGKIARMEELVRTVDETILHITGEKPMSKKRMFRAFSAEEQKQYEREARLQYGPANVNESIKRWNGYSEAQRQTILDEGSAIYSEIVAAIEAGSSSTDEAVQALLARWHEHIRHFYEPTLEILRGLGDLYNDDERFKANFDQMHPDLATFMRSGINHYVDELETREIERLLAEDELRNAGEG